MSGRRPGPAPQPAELNALKGNPGKRKLPNPPHVEKPDKAPPVPAVLKSAGREAWRLYWTFGKAWLAFTDIPLVTRLCRLIDRADEAEATIDAEGFLNVTESGRSSMHHTYSNVLGIYKAIADLESAAGFTPSDRSRLKGDPADEGDEVDQWAKATG